MSETPALVHGLPVCGTLDLFSPYLDTATLVAVTADVFGPRATTLSAWYALDARQSRRDGDYRLWLTAFKHHQSRNQRAS